MMDDIEIKIKNDIRKSYLQGASAILNSINYFINNSKEINIKLLRKFIDKLKTYTMDELKSLEQNEEQPKN